RQYAALAMEMPEDVQEARRLGAERAGVAVDEMELSVEEHEPVGQRLLALPALGRAPPRQRLLAARDQAARHTMDHPGMQIVVAHEPLDAERGVVVLVAQILRDPRLAVAPERVVLVPGAKVQLVARAPEEGQRRVGRRLLARRDEPLVGQLAQRAGAELRL